MWPKIVSYTLELRTLNRILNIQIQNINGILKYLNIPYYYNIKDCREK